MIDRRNQSSTPEVRHWTAHRLPELSIIRDRLLRIFPTSAPEARRAASRSAPQSLFVFLYAFAIDGVTDHCLRPMMVTTMSDAQGRRFKVDERIAWWRQAAAARGADHNPPDRWFAQDTRETIRDETFRVWRDLGAVLELPLPTTSSRPRWRLERSFADLFDPELDDARLNQAIDEWRRNHLTPAALARVALHSAQSRAATGAAVRLPDGSSRVIEIGPSTPLLKAAVEEFAPRFLAQPVVLLATESRQRLAYQHEQQLRLIGLRPDVRIMPDLLLADLGCDKLRFVFLECVATDGPMNAGRVDALRSWIVEEGFGDAEAAFGTVFLDRGESVFRRFAGELAWGSLAWFVSEPDHLMALYDGGAINQWGTLASLVRPLER